MSKIEKIFSLEVCKNLNLLRSLCGCEEKSKHEGLKELTRFEINLDNPRCSYQAGEIVSGDVFVSLNHPVSIRGIKIKLIGVASTKWEDTIVGKFRNCYTTTCRMDTFKTEHVIYRIQNVFGFDGTKNNISITQGRHQYPFCFRLPKTLPSSLSHKLGSLKYFVEAIIIQEPQSLMYVNDVIVKRKLEILVAAVVDLRFVLEVRSTARMYREDEIGLFYICGRGMVGFNVVLPKSGFTPGEKIPFKLNLFNQSQRIVHAVTLAIIQVNSFFIGSKYRRSIKTIRQVDGPVVGPGKDEIWQDNLGVHSVPPTSFGRSKIIDIKYYLKVKMKVKYEVTLVGQMPIIIGTIPSRSKFQDHRIKCLSWAGAESNMSEQSKSITTLRIRSPTM